MESMMWARALPHAAASMPGDFGEGEDHDVTIRYSSDGGEMWPVIGVIIHPHDP